MLKKAMIAQIRCFIRALSYLVNMAGASQIEIDEVESFLQGQKTLDSPSPIWQKSSYIDELQCTWLIVDSLGIKRGALRFSCSKTRVNPSITVTFRSKLIWRTDVVAPTECKPNPIGAAAFKLPATVCGSHHHSWPDNSAYVAAVGFGRLPFRRPLNGHVRRLSQALAELAQAINLTLDDEQRTFDVPPASDLFEGVS